MRSRASIGSGLIATVAFSAALARGAGATPARSPRAVQVPVGGASNPELDVLHYDFDLTIDPEQRTVSGRVIITAAARAGVEEMEIDLADNLELYAVQVDGAPVDFVRHPGYLSADLGGQVGPGEQVELEVVYGGAPEYLGSWPVSGLEFDLTATGEPWIYSLDEPRGAHTWVPVVDDAADKASWTLRATVPSGLVVASNGLEVTAPVDNGDGTTTFHWSTGYQHSIYLFALNVGPFLYAEDTYRRLDGELMPVVVYALPEHFDAAVTYFAPTVSMLEFLADRFGEYPFADEKYGHVAVGHSGMENVTLTSLAPYYFSEEGSITVLHELAHQWFGNHVTMKGWRHVWLNESWATYCEALWWEQLDPASIQDYGWSGAGQSGTVIAEDPTAPFDDPGAIYYKGARVLHMLRRLVGDQVFFTATRAYLARFGGGHADTADLQAEFEAAYGDELGWFFDQWIHQPASPQLVAWHRVDSVEGSPRVTVYVKQVQRHHLYRFRLDLVVDGERYPRWVDGDGDLTVLELPAASLQSAVAVDPDGDLLAYLSDLGAADYADIPVVTAAASRQAGVAPFEVTLTATSPESLAGYSVEWLVWESSSGLTTVPGATTTLQVAPGSFYWEWVWVDAYLQLTSSASDTVIRYPVPIYLYAYDPEAEGVAAALAGDIVRDGVVDGVDLAVAAASLGPSQWTGPYRGDLDNDGDTDDDDLAMIAARIGEVVPVSKRRAPRTTGPAWWRAPRTRHSSIPGRDVRAER